jgi:hypothetical protein
MQFLVYITVLMVSIATVLLEVHWLTSPSPQPKPAIQSAGGRAPAPKVEGPNAALSPVYPRRLETPRPEDLNSNEQAQASTNSMTTGSKLDLAGQAAPAQRQQDRQTPVTQQAPITAPAPQLPAAATAPPVQKASPETTGMATREQSPNQASVDAMNASTRTNNPQEPTSAVLPSNNRCDVQACSSSYRSFRASDCTISHLKVSDDFVESLPCSGLRASRGTSLSVAGGVGTPSCRAPLNGAHETLTMTVPNSITPSAWDRASSCSVGRDAGRTLTYMPFCGALSRNCRSASL